MSSWSPSTKVVGDAQEVILYRREPLRSPDEVLSEARKNHTIFKANVVTGGLRPSSRHVGLSRFQFGDGEYAASVESMQRFIAEKTVRQEPLPEMQEPVQLTRTLSRSLSSRHNPFRTSSRTKLHLEVDVAAPRAVKDVALGVAAGDDHDRKTAAAACGSVSGHNSMMLPGPDAEPAAQPLDSDGATPRSLGSGAISGSGSGSRRLTSHSFSTLPSGLTPSNKAAPPPLDMRAYWSVTDSVGDGEDDAGNSDRERDGEDVNGDPDADHGGGGDRQRRRTYPANAFASLLYRSTASAAVSSDPDSYDSSPGGATSPFSTSYSNPFMRRNSIHLGGGHPHSMTADSPTGRVDKLLSDLRRLKAAAAPPSAAKDQPGGLSGAASAASSLPKRAGSGAPTARFSNAGAGVGGSAGGSVVGSVSGAVQAGFGSSGRLEPSAREVFSARGRSATTTHLPDDSGGGTGTGSGQSDPKHPPHPPSSSVPQLILQIQPPSTASSGPASPLLSRPLSAALHGGGGGGGGGGGPLSPGFTSAVGPSATATPGGAGASGGGHGPSLYHRITRSPTGDGDRSGPYPNSPFSSLAAAAAAGSPTTAPSSPRPPPRPISAMPYNSPHGPGVMGGHVAPVPPPGSPSGSGPPCRVSSRKLLMEGAGPAAGLRASSPGSPVGLAAGAAAAAAAAGGAAAPAAAGPSPVRPVSSGNPLDGWSSRSGRGVRSHASVGSFFASLLHSDGAPADSRQKSTTAA